MKESNDIIYKTVSPDISLIDFVKSFWMIKNLGPKEKRYTIFPDGHFDIILRSTVNKECIVSLTGLSLKEFECVLPGYTTFFAVSFKLPAAEYILKTSIESIVDNQKVLKNDFWNIKWESISNFDNFVEVLALSIEKESIRDIDKRKKELFSFLYSSNGSISIENISNKVNWSSRQVNRYFSKWFGISLKAFCDILRYRASFEQLKEGNLYPEKNYFDQSHFIKDVKKYSGVTPKKISKNKNDRFIQLSTLPKK